MLPVCHYRQIVSPAKVNLKCSVSAVLVPSKYAIVIPKLFILFTYKCMLQLPLDKV